MGGGNEISVNRVVQREDRLNLMGKAVQEKRIIMSSLNEKLDRTVLWEGGGGETLSLLCDADWKEGVNYSTFPCHFSSLINISAKLTSPFSAHSEKKGGERMQTPVTPGKQYLGADKHFQN